MEKCSDVELFRKRVSFQAGLGKAQWGAYRGSKENERDGLLSASHDVAMEKIGAQTLIRLICIQLGVVLGAVLSM